MGAGTDLPPGGGLERIIKGFERAIVVVLIVMMMVVVALGAIDLGRLIVKSVADHPVGVVPVSELLELFGFFLLILIGLELLETMKAYLRENVVHIEVVLEVALIAVARKVIVLDVGKYDGVTVLAIGVLIVALAGAYILLTRRRGGTGTR
jgi:uncharacterized membrane protein (DUF373 family)